MRELTIAAVEVEAVCGPAGRFPYPELRQVLPLDVYRSPGEPSEAGREPDPGQIVEALYLRITTRQGPQGLYGPVDPVVPFLSERILAVVQADPEWCGGVTELVRICALAETFGVPVIPHGHGLHTAIHVVASQSPGTCPMTEYLYRIMPGRHRFEAAPPEPAHGAFPLPQRPGFGIELNDEAITSRRPCSSCRSTRRRPRPGTG